MQYLNWRLPNGTLKGCSVSISKVMASKRNGEIYLKIKLRNFKNKSDGFPPPKSLSFQRQEILQNLNWRLPNGDFGGNPSLFLVKFLSFIFRYISQFLFEAITFELDTLQPFKATFGSLQFKYCKIDYFIRYRLVAFNRGQKMSTKSNTKSMIQKFYLHQYSRLTFFQIELIRMWCILLKFYQKN